ncbi:hypothetical protein TNCV_1555391 [Trichonephila clavipes]|nr:hypothetical protein TNCV_1555391 [Trichonephila clavipes]
MAPFRLQLVKRLQVFGKLVRFYHGAIRNVLMHLLMQGVGKGSIVVEFRQHLQEHGTRKIFCCSVPLTTMNPPRPIWLNLPLTQKSEPGMIPRDHLGITAIVENWGNGEFDGHWLAQVTLASAK